MTYQPPPVASRDSRPIAVRRCFFIGTPLRRTAVSGHFQALAHELVRRGHEAVIIAPPGECEPDPGQTRFHVHAWPSTRPTRFADAAFLWRLIGRYDPDCLIANFGSVNWMCLIGWLRRVRCRIAWYHTLSSQINIDSKFTLRRLRTLRFRKGLVYRWATHLAVNSHAALADAGQTYGVPAEKCKVWRNSLPDPELYIRLHASSDREDLVVCAGRFDRTKGQDILIQALALCRERLETTKIEFLGDGPLLDSMRRRAAELGLGARCQFRGFVSHPEVIDRMSGARLTVVPSRSEAFGLVNIESMSVGTPVIASSVDGIKEIVRHGVDGVLVPPDDAPALANELLPLLHDAARRGQMGRQARARFLAVYEQSKVVTAQADWLENMLASAPSSRVASPAVV
jgi:glycosyltransferase involved in cell wall biosynthesis